MSNCPQTPAEVLSRIDSKRRPRPPMAVPFVRARNNIEASLAAFWCEILRLEEVGVDDDFLDLGGNSLQMIRILSRIQARYEIEMTIDVFFDNLTIASLAKILHDAIDNKSGNTT